MSKKSRYLVSPNRDFSVTDCCTQPDQKHGGKKQLKKQLKSLVGELDTLQRKLYADNRYSLLLVFQAMDAAGKDSTIRSVLSGVNPQGCQVYSFKKPSAEELDHDFLWRTSKSLPERGRIGVFNRSYYEETLVVKVHPEYLQNQHLPELPPLEELWEDRYQSIREHEKHLSKNGTIVLKFWLNVSKEEQNKRLLDRLQTPEKNWKFEAGDLAERKLWKEYMQAYEDTINATSTKESPWFAIPADNKPFMRLQVAQIIVDELKKRNLTYPVVSEEQRQEFASYEQELLNEQ